jgi:hypothetical protein
MDITELTGKKVFVRTVTNYYTGRLVSTATAAGSVQDFLHLEEAAWVADTGRFADALKTGKLNEVEPFPGDCWVSTGAVVDISEWHHELPRTQK